MNLILQKLLIFYKKLEFIRKLNHQNYFIIKFD